MPKRIGDPPRRRPAQTQAADPMATCAECGTALPAGMRFCGYCGARLPDTPGPVAERRHLSVMFCDLVGSTELARRLDPEDLRDVLRDYQDAATRAVRRFDGHVAEYLGDGVVCYFGFPVAHEDDAERAVRAALDVIGELRGVRTSAGRRLGVDLAARIGIHTGARGDGRDRCPRRARRRAHGR